MNPSLFLKILYNKNLLLFFFYDDVDFSFNDVNGSSDMSSRECELLRCKTKKYCL